LNKNKEETFDILMSLQIITQVKINVKIIQRYDVETANKEFLLKSFKHGNYILMFFMQTLVTYSSVPRNDF
jgi:hypothetical protein